MNSDFLIVGAGIVGLTIARELKHRFPDASIVVLEKEPRLGLHASGRNSGVLHSGVYYPPGSVKARICVQGAALMRTYCETHDLPLRQIGKLILPLREGDGDTLERLYGYSQENGAGAEVVDAQQLKSLEPEAACVIGRALYLPQVCCGRT